METSLETERLRIGDDVGGLAAGECKRRDFVAGEWRRTGDLLVAGD